MAMPTSPRTTSTGGKAPSPAAKPPSTLLTSEVNDKDVAVAKIMRDTAISATEPARLALVVRARCRRAIWIPLSADD